MKKDRTGISKILQDTFDELQAELARQREELEGAGEFEHEIDLEKIVAELAKDAGFEILEMIGAGGMGAVVKARDSKLKRIVALKFLPPEVLRNPDDAQELRREAEIASCIQHENVVQIFSWHEVENVPFYVMEYIDGENVESLVRKRGKLPPIEALRITAEAARGLEALHQVGIIHRDIKPQNILISRDGRVKITDFGISRTQEMISHEVQKTKTIAGTPKFMAPEQARGEAATKHSDIYSLGASLYFMLTAKPPVEPATDIRQQIANVREGKIIPVSNHLPKLSREVVRLVSRSLAPMQSKRPWDVESFRKEIDQAFLSLTLSQHGSFWSFFSKRRALIATFIALMIGIAIGFLGGYEIAATRYRQIESAPSPLASLAVRERTRLDEILQTDPNAREVATLRDDLDLAIRENSTERMAELSLVANRLAQRWQVLMTVRREAGDPSSPLREEALKILSVFEKGTPQEVQEAIQSWRVLWIETIRRETPANRP